MKTVFYLAIFFIAQPILGQSEFAYRFYTPEVVVEDNSKGEKGAVQLLWEKSPRPSRYEVEVSNGRSVYSSTGEKHYLHVMIYFDQNYQWRVREVSANRTTDFSEWRPLKVIRNPIRLAHHQPLSQRRIRKAVQEEPAEFRKPSNQNDGSEVQNIFVDEGSE